MELEEINKILFEYKKVEDELKAMANIYLNAYHGGHYCGHADNVSIMRSNMTSNVNEFRFDFSPCTNGDHIGRRGGYGFLPLNLLNKTEEIKAMAIADNELRLQIASKRKCSECGQDRPNFPFSLDEFCITFKR